MDSIHIINKKISRQQLQRIAEKRYGDMAKAVVDIKKGIIAVGGELHADEEAILIEQGSKQQDLWGINLYPGKSDEDLIEFDSVINLRPSQDNRSRGVDSPNTRKKIERVVQSLIE